MRLFKKKVKAGLYDCTDCSECDKQIGCCTQPDFPIRTIFFRLATNEIPNKPDTDRKPSDCTCAVPDEDGCPYGKEQ
jgi:hypothetical protein